MVFIFFSINTSGSRVTKQWFSADFLGTLNSPKSIRSLGASEQELVKTKLLSELAKEDAKLTEKEALEGSLDPMELIALNLKMLAMETNSRMALLRAAKDGGVDSESDEVWWLFYWRFTKAKT